MTLLCCRSLEVTVCDVFWRDSVPLDLRFGRLSSELDRQIPSLSVRIIIVIVWVPSFWLVPPGWAPLGGYAVSKLRL